MFKVTLIPDAKKAITYVSTMCMAAAGALVTTWMLLDSEAKASIGTTQFHAGVLAVIVLGFVGRFLKAIEPSAPPEVLVPASGEPATEKPIAAIVSAAPTDSAAKETP